MNVRLLIITLAMLLTYSLTVNAIDVLEESRSLTIDQGETKTVDITIKNTDLVNPVNVTFFHDLDLVDNGGDKIILSFSDPGSIAAGASTTVTMTFDAEDDIDFESYTGIITMKDSNGETDTLTMEVIVEPDVCKFGSVGSDLEIKIENPNTDDEFKPGEIMNIRVNVKNVGDDDIKTQVHAFLFSEKVKIVDQAAPTSNIENGKDEDFKFTMQIPLDARRIDEDESYFLVIKALDDNNEGANCVMERVDIDVQLDNEDVIIDEEGTYFFPSTATCGDNVVANVQVTNIGGRDNDRVQVSVTNDELSIQVSSFVFSLGAFSAEEDNTKPVQVEIPLPKSAALKDYPFRVAVTHDGGTETTTMVLPVTACDSLSGLIERGVPIASVTVASDNIYAQQGDLLAFPVKIRNEFSTRTTYFIALTNIEELGESTVKTITLAPGQETTVFMELSLREDAPEGTHSAVIEVSAGSTLVRTETATITIAPQVEEPLTIERMVGAIPTPVWVVIDMLVVVLVLSMIILTTQRWRENHSS